VKRIKFLFDRYIAFETAHGSEDAVNTVRQKALNYADRRPDTDKLEQPS